MPSGSNLISSSNGCLHLRSGFVPSGNPIITLHALFLSPVRDTFPAPLIILLFTTLIDILNFFFYFWCNSPEEGQSVLIHKDSRSHRTIQHSRQDSSARVISSSQRPLPDNTQHSQQTDIHASGGIRTQDLSRRAAADPRLRQCGHWDRLSYLQ